MTIDGRRPGSRLRSWAAARPVRRPPLALARVGHSVVMLERSRYESDRIGETLPPEVRLPLDTLGVWPRFLGLGPIPSPGMVSCWGSATPRTWDALVNPYGPGWRVDRRRFDAMLAHAVGEAGGTVWLSTRLGSACREGRGDWRLVVDSAGRSSRIAAGMIVDATGRRSPLLRRLGVGRILQDRLVGLAAFCPASRPPRTPDQRTLVEAIEGGWWYSAALPDGRRVASFLTDADLIPRGIGAISSFWGDQLRAAPLTLARLDRPSRPMRVRAWDASSSRPGRVAGESWARDGRRGGGP